MAGLTSSSASSLRKEIQEYIKACEHLLSSSVASDHAPLSVTEQQVLQYYVEELQKHLLVSQTN